MMATGFILGVLLGYLLKRSRFCFTGLLRDVFLEGRTSNLGVAAAIVCVQGAIYYALGVAGAIQLPSYLPPFSLAGVALGSFLFGLGAVLAQGCLATTLVKCGDGRLAGWAALASFTAAGYVLSAGFGQPVTRALRSVAVVSDDLPGRLSAIPLAVFAALAAGLCVWLIRRVAMRSRARRFAPPARFTGVRHVLFEKALPTECAAIAVGALFGLAFLASEAVGRHYGIALALPTLSWAFATFPPETVVGGCNPYDTAFGWGSLLVAGIAVGSFATTVAAGEFSLVKPAPGVLPRAIAGGLLMGAGAIWGAGCLVSNGFVGTAQLSLKSWFALAFLLLGIWAGVRLFLQRGKR